MPHKRGLRQSSSLEEWRAGLVSGAASSIAGAVLAEATRAILEKIKRGEKLSPEELLLLWIDLVHSRLDSLDEKVERVRRELLAALDQRVGELRREVVDVRREVLELRRELGSRIDRLYELLAGRVG